MGKDLLITTLASLWAVNIAVLYYYHVWLRLHR